MSHDQDSGNFENKRPLRAKNYGLFNFGANIGTQILIKFFSLAQTKFWYLA